MQNIFAQFKTALDATHLSEEEKKPLLATCQQVEKMYVRLDFLHNRSMKDKAISINILKSTVEALQEQKAVVEAINQQLIDQKKLLEEQSQQLTKNLQQLQMSYNEMEQFAYIASHDLKSPLRNIGSYAQLLKRRYRGKIDEDADEFIDFIVNNAQMMNDIITDLLEYSRVDKERELVLIDPHRLLELVKNNLKEAIEETRASIELSPMPAVWAHRSGLIQLFQNLIENAIKFHADVPPRIQISAETDSAHHCYIFHVSDNGLGLDEAFQEKAFMPFQRINHRDRPGSGMGLAICRKVVKLHGGDIWYQRNATGGTTFSFTLAMLPQP